jgi:hypothetical protein
MEDKMKSSILSLLLVMIAACSTMRAPTDEGLQEVAIVLIKNQLASQSYMRANRTMAYYVTIGETDLSAGSIDRLSGHGVVFLPGSAWSEGKGMKMDIGAPVLRPDGDFDVIHGYACGMRCSSVHKAVMRHSRNGWTVVSSEMALISATPTQPAIVATLATANP